MEPGPQIEVRRAAAAEAGAVADVWLRSRHASVPAIPAPVHTDDEVRGWFADVMLPTREVWVAIARDASGGASDPVGADDRHRAPGPREPDEPDEPSIVAVLVLDGDWLDQLHVDAGWFGRGIGSVLVELAKRRRPGGLDLWTFASNTGARRFYARHGFVVVATTDGDNEEGEPDVRYRWPAVTPARPTERHGPAS